MSATPSTGDGEATFDAGNDSQGPIPVAVAANADLSQQGQDENGTSRLVVYGSDACLMGG